MFAYGFKSYGFYVKDIISNDIIKEIDSSYTQCNLKGVTPFLDL